MGGDHKFAAEGQGFVGSNRRSYTEKAIMGRQKINRTQIHEKGDCR